MTFVAGVLSQGKRSSELFASLQALLPLSLFNWRTHSDAELSFGVVPTVRLAEDASDRQPLQLRHLHLVGDIRVDNRDELAAKFGWSPSHAAEQADSSYFLEAWSRWGKQALDHLIGGFAVALWDANSRQLTLVRDHVGERSLYFLHSGDTFAFASLPQMLRCVPGVDTSLDEDKLLHYLAIVSGPPTQTFFRNIQQLPMGHLLTFRNGHVTLDRYWHPLDAPAIRLKTDDDYIEAFRERFDRAVAARLRTTGKVGAQLSGGMDSASVTATAARLLGSERLTAFTSVPQAAFGDRNPFGRFGNEGPAAAEVAAMYPNIDHILVDSSQEDLIGGIQSMGRLQGQPVFNPLNEMWFTATMKIARARGVTVLLQGACGNATLSAGGLVGLSKLFRNGHWIRLARLVHGLRRRGHASWRGAASYAVGPYVPQWLWRRLSPEPADFNFDFSPVHPALAETHHLREKAWNEFFGADRSIRGFQRLMYEYYDPGFVNASTSLGWQVELRDPTQDKRVFEYCFAIPIEQYLVGGQTRSLVRRAMRGYLPEATLARTTRGLQSADWFLTLGGRLPEMKEELARIRMSPTANRLLDLDRLDRLLDTWPTDGFEQAAVADAWHLALTRGIAVGNFIRQFETGA